MTPTVNQADIFWQDDKTTTYVCDGKTCGYLGDTHCSNCGYEAGEMTAAS